MYINLVRLRKENKETQEDIAKLIKCSPSNYSRRERGDIEFRIGEMEIIKKHFDKPLDEIFFKYEPTKNSIKE